MLEGGGKTPILNPLELEKVGFKLVVYPLSLIGVSIQAMQVRFLHHYCAQNIKRLLSTCLIAKGNRIRGGFELSPSLSLAQFERVELSSNQLKLSLAWLKGSRARVQL